MLQATRAQRPACSARTSRRAIIVRAQRDGVKDPTAVSLRASGAALLAAATLALNVVPAMDPTAALMVQPAHAEEEASDEGLSPYQRRQRELERRREMLRAAREAAEAKAGGDAPAASTEAADAAVDAANAARSAAVGGELKSSAAAAYEASSSSSTTRYRGFGGFNAAPAPAPAPAVVEPTPAPEPAKPAFSWNTPAPAPKPEPVVEAKKPEPKKAEQPKKEEPAGKQKRRGPLPLFLAEVVVLGGFAGVVAAATKYSAETNKALALAGAKVKELYGMAESALAKAK
ncbi:hypothetical protein CHLRE_12g549350v5 [Chlamydomonas reinhardtii]|uniref:Uncharacterized protein n=1 Tax=Chlamydomonas reinhardtii TaxID=3055 RepID=A0A2K3D6A0_CHLRE|nr:uncharacterized protein CHLRE_12g549350v5 [Chlamydomonas reinhardtii]PNW76056.1 hypothetical protein CHLRE_12g549350v5 [Chlamydomonas reinhardtii]